MHEISAEYLTDKVPVNVGIVGATGLVGSIMLDILEERQFPLANLRLFASSKSAGHRVDWKDSTLKVEDASSADYSGLDIVLFSAGAEVARLLAPKVVEFGAVVIDNSSAFREDDDIPLVETETNPEDIANRPRGIIANPNCTTMIAMPVLKPLHDAAGLEAMVVNTFQAVSGAGRDGIIELSEQMREKAEPRVFPEPVAYNVIPMRGNLVGRNTDEELKLIFESRKILHLSQLAVTAACNTVPVFTGHSLSIDAKFKNHITPEMAEEILSHAGGVQLTDIPTPLKAANGNVSLVGRIRKSGVFGDNGLTLFISGDNLRKGAALNAVLLAELLVKSGIKNIFAS